MWLPLPHSTMIITIIWEAKRVLCTSTINCLIDVLHILRLLPTVPIRSLSFRTSKPPWWIWVISNSSLAPADKSAKTAGSPIKNSDHYTMHTFSDYVFLVSWSAARKKSINYISIILCAEFERAAVTWHIEKNYALNVGFEINYIG
jgi:hypothetical protein